MGRGLSRVAERRSRGSFFAHGSGRNRPIGYRTHNRGCREGGYPVYKFSALNVPADPSILPEDGFVILGDVQLALPIAVPTVVGGYKHLVRRGLRVGLLVVGSSARIKALRGHPAMGFLSRADWVYEPET